MPAIQIDISQILTPLFGAISALALSIAWMYRDGMARSDKRGDDWRDYALKLRDILDAQTPALRTTAELAEKSGATSERVLQTLQAIWYRRRAVDLPPATSAVPGDDEMVLP